jgi:LuxR family maltose regulon positive regulatory protein
MSQSNALIEAGLLIRTKLHMPRVVSGLVERPRLIERLNQGLQRKVTLISAPAGYGKSTLAATWLQQLSRPTAWVSLDEQDSALAHFLSYLIEAIHTIFPRACAKTASFLEAPELPSTEYLVKTLINELATLPQTGDDAATDPRTSFVLALDDYHRLDGPGVHSFMSRLIEYQPPQLHLVLIGRKDPVQLPLPQLRGRQELLEIRLKDLCFDVSETQTFLSRIVDPTLPDEVVTALTNRTEGWVLGLHLVSLSLRDQADPVAYVQALQGTDRYVMEYLLDEILAHQPEAIQKFLLSSSILDRFCGPLCEAVAGLDDPTCNGQAYLEWLEQINLFVINLDNRRQWYRFHHLFQDLLLHKLKVEHPARKVADLHRRASRWLADYGDLETAITHALQADDIELAAGIIETRRHELVKRENWLVLSQLLNRLPQAAIAQRPVLLVVKGWERRTIGDFVAVDSFLDQAETVLGEQPGLVDEATETELRGQMDCLRAFSAWFRSHFEQAVTLCRRAYDRLSPDQFAYALTRHTDALVLMATGHLDQARQLLRQALETGSDHKYAHLHEANWYAVLTTNYFSGEWVETERVAQHIVTLFGDQPMNPVLNTAHYVLGTIHYEWDHLEKAQHYFSLVISRLVYALTYQDSFICLALYHQALGRPDLARQALDELMAFIGATGRAHLLLAVEAMTAQLALMAGDTGAAIRWANAAELGPPAPIRIFYKEPHISQAKVLIAQGTAASLARAQQTLQAVLAAAEKSHNRQRTVEALAGQALAYAAQGDQARALNRLERGLTLAWPQGFIRTFVDYGPALAELLQKLQPDDKALEPYLQQLLAAFGRKTAQTPLPAAQPLPEPLTDRELEILARLAKRQAYKEIAAALVISPNTVKVHVSNIYQKLGVNRRQQAVTKANALKLLPTPTEQA